MPDPNLQPCPNCSHVFAVYHERCPACGKPRAAPAKAARLDLRDWVLEARPDGTARIRRSFAYRLWCRAALVGLVFCAGMLVLDTGYHRRPMPRLPGSGLELAVFDLLLLVGTAVLVVGTGALAGIVLVGAFGTEEWTAESGRLTHHYALARWNWERHYSGGELVLTSHWQTSRWRWSGYRVDRLRLRAGGADVDVARDESTGRAVPELAAVLAEITGWPLQDRRPRV